ncbi:hypothetical protein BO86DRAFT_391587, partial [Aspergillus japonicus CBS 114.51]
MDGGAGAGAAVLVLKLKAASAPPSQRQKLFPPCIRSAFHPHSLASFRSGRVGSSSSWGKWEEAGGGEEEEGAGAENDA